MRSQSLPDVGDRLRPVTIQPVGLQVKLAGLHVTNDEIIPLFLSFVKGLNAPSVPAVVPAPVPVPEPAPPPSPSTDSTSGASEAE